SAYDGGLVLIGEASAYPHGSKKPHVVAAGDIVLMDCTSSVHGYQSDITRTFVVGTPSAEQRKLWDQVHRGQQIAIETAKVGLLAHDRGGAEILHPAAGEHRRAIRARLIDQGRTRLEVVAAGLWRRLM